MESLTKENFWNEMEQKYPRAMAHFQNWIDGYKRANKWNRLFNGHATGEGAIVPKYHELPIAIQFGIFLEYICSYCESEGLTLGDTGFTMPHFKIGVTDSIKHLLYLLEDAL